MHTPHCRQTPVHTCGEQAYTSALHCLQAFVLQASVLQSSYQSISFACIQTLNASGMRRHHPIALHSLELQGTRLPLLASTFTLQARTSSEKTDCPGSGPHYPTPCNHHCSRQQYRMHCSEHVGLQPHPAGQACSPQQQEAIAYLYCTDPVNRYVGEPSKYHPYATTTRSAS